MRFEFLTHAKKPGKLERHAGKSDGTEARRDGEAVAQVALAIAGELIVDREHERVIRRGGGAFGELAGEAAIPIDEDLHPARRGAASGDRLERHDRGMARAIDGAGRRRRRAPRRISPSGQKSPERPVGPIEHRQCARPCRRARSKDRARGAPRKGRGKRPNAENAVSLRRSVRSSSAPPSAKSKIGRGRTLRAVARKAAMLWARRRQPGSASVTLPSPFARGDRRVGAWSHLRRMSSPGLGTFYPNRGLPKALACDKLI